MDHSLERCLIETHSNNIYSICLGCVKTIRLGLTEFLCSEPHNTMCLLVFPCIEQGTGFTATAKHRVRMNSLNKEKLCLTCIDPMQTYSASTSGTKSVPFKVFSDSRSMSNSPCPSTNGMLWRINNTQGL